MADKWIYCREAGTSDEVMDTGRRGWVWQTCWPMEVAHGLGVKVRTEQPRETPRTVSKG